MIYLLLLLLIAPLLALSIGLIFRFRDRFSDGTAVLYVFFCLLLTGYVADGIDVMGGNDYVKLLLVFIVPPLLWNGLFFLLFSKTALHLRVKWPFKRKAAE